jgi:predicted enzyme related to lactoylglutathione lyase
VDRLLYVIVFTTDLEGTTRFYRDQLGLELAQDGPYWRDYRTGGARLGTMAVHPGMACEIEVSLHAPDLDTTVASLKARGVSFMGDIKEIPFGRVAHLRDPDGTLLSLYAPRQVPFMLDGPPRATLMINAGEFAATVAFYRDTLGLQVAAEDRGWVEFDTGVTRLSVHRRPRSDDHPDHAGQKVVFGLEVEDLGRDAAEARRRGLRFSTAPTDSDFGPYAEAMDAEGNLVVLRERASEPSLETVLAEPFDDDEAPARSAIRKPVKKQSKAMSRVVLKPEYKAKKKKSAARGTAPKRTRDVVSARGTGPAGTRVKPKTQRDTKRAKAKPASGRAMKASDRAATGKKSAAARASKSKPVKRAVARGGRRA